MKVSWLSECTMTQRGDGTSGLSVISAAPPDGALPQVPAAGVDASDGISVVLVGEPGTVTNAWVVVVFGSTRCGASRPQATSATSSSDAARYFTDPSARRAPPTRSPDRRT